VTSFATLNLSMHGPGFKLYAPHFVVFKSYITWVHKSRHYAFFTFHHLLYTSL